jgi:hypothetical protein
VAGVSGIGSLPVVPRVLLLALLVGIVTMHAIVVPSAHAMVHDTAATAMDHHATSGNGGPAPQPCQGDDCDSAHGGLHGCVFIVTAISFLAGLALLCWIGVALAASITPQLHRRCRQRQRAPPWTVLSLSELSLLRI